MCVGRGAGGGGDGALVLVLAGEFDSGTVVPFRRALAEAQAGQAVRTIIDVSGVAYADSGLLRLLLETHRR
ncbi:STAS domain-containing protein, partial [Streptomyces sp. NPDC059949]|uniref:STAS domain-containing protein n=1 Tax=Streptomyces sp. NPDC059949 TaxID=3347013 RepID=UPI0036511976